MRTYPALDVINEWLMYQYAQGDWPGFQVSIRRRGNLIYSRAFGYSDLEKKAHYKTSHIAQIASLSKVVTSAVVLWLQSQKMLSLQDRVVSILPELKTHKDLNFRRITIEHLLTHRSGLFRDSLEKGYWALTNDFISSEQLLIEVKKTGLIYKPGTKTKYSNMGYALLGAVIERATGRLMIDLAREFLSARGSFERLFSDEKKTDLAVGYLRMYLHGQRFKRVKIRSVNAMTPAAGFRSNADTITEFVSQLYLGELLPKSERSLLIKTKFPVANMKNESYGLGTIFSEFNGATYVGHSGGFPGFSSQAWVVPKTEMAFGFITNTSVVKTLNAVYGMNEIISAIEFHFSKSEMRSLLVSKPFAENFNSTIYVVGKKKALAFPLTGWRPTEDLMVFKRHGDHFRSETLSGYRSLGEAVRFNIRNREIRSVKVGGYESFPAR